MKGNPMFDISTKRASETGAIKLRNGDGSPLRNGDGNQLTVTIHSPASKTWQAAQADKQRKAVERMQEAGGRTSAALDEAKRDQVEFLVAITVSFDGFGYGKTTGAEMFRAAYDDDALGYIRDQVFAGANDWEVFTGGSATG